MSLLVLVSQPSQRLASLGVAGQSCLDLRLDSRRSHHDFGIATEPLGGDVEIAAGVEQPIGFSRRELAAVLGQPVNTFAVRLEIAGVLPLSFGRDVGDRALQAGHNVYVR